MAWQGNLHIHYRRREAHTVAHDRHDGPLRVLRALHPEGPGVCHHVLVHPPGGLVSGDELHIRLDLAPGAHALLTTPGATRFYRSTGQPATQHVSATLQAGARLEWLPLETILHRQSRGRSHVRFALAPEAQMMGWDMLALGLPASAECFDQGHFEQQLEWPGTWLERGVLDLDAEPGRTLTQRLLHSPLGWQGHTVLATMWLASGSPWSAQSLHALLEATRAACPGRDDRAALHGVSSPSSGLLVLRVLAQRTELAWPILRAVREAWRRVAWQMSPCTPRVWHT